MVDNNARSPHCQGKMTRVTDFPSFDNQVSQLRGRTIKPERLLILRNPI